MSINPGYDALTAFFINNLNGVYALVNIRGGGYVIVATLQLINSIFIFWMSSFQTIFTITIN